MKESHAERLATHSGPESCEVARKGSVEALTGVRAGRVLSREGELTSGSRRCRRKRKATPVASLARDAAGPCAVRDPGTHGNNLLGNREILSSPATAVDVAGRVGKSKDVRRR